MKQPVEAWKRLTRIFHTRNAGSGDPAYKERTGGVVGRVPSRGGRSPLPSAYEKSGQGAFPNVNGEGTPATGHARGPHSPGRLASLVLLLGGVLVLAAEAPESADPAATFFMGRIKYSNNDGNDCGGVGQELIRLVSRASTVKVQQEKRLRLTDPEMFETPFLFMNGHNDFALSAEEIEALKKYFGHGGFVFLSGCCTNPNFPKAARREFSRIFANEKVKVLPYDHPIYRSFYLITRVRCLHEDRDIRLEGLFYQGRLVMVLCEDGLCCAFSMDNRCNAGKGVSPEDGQKLALNIAVYSMTH